MSRLENLFSWLRSQLGPGGKKKIILKCFEEEWIPSRFEWLNMPLHIPLLDREFWTGVETSHFEQVLRYHILNRCWDITFWTGVETSHFEQVLRYHILNRCWDITFWTGVEISHIEQVLRHHILNRCWDITFWTGVETSHFEQVLRHHILNRCWDITFSRDKLLLGAENFNVNNIVEKVCSSGSSRIIWNLKE
jgi:hypothetical protein